MAVGDVKRLRQSRMLLSKGHAASPTADGHNPNGRAAFIPRSRRALAFTGPVEGSRAVAEEIDAVLIIFETAEEAEAHCEKINGARRGMGIATPRTTICAGFTDR